MVQGQDPAYAGESMSGIREKNPIASSQLS